LDFKDFKRLITILQFKTKQNSCYYIVKEDFEFKEQDFKIYKGAMLINSNISTYNNDTLFLSVLYKVKPVGSAISIIDVDEGLIKLEYRDLASLLVAGRIQAYYVDKNEPDREIFELINGQVKIKSVS
jgi:hypothetical protein